ncbi:transaldolase [Mycena metata]|uniref:Transaldolase n=1 Tax=Mycena metata TaxID=1033252 RepID=A0AAD7JVR9_9AGAR|nr:transaldolase [Mycena metata]
MSAPSALQALRESGIRISSDTAEYHQILEFKADLTDATTNPSLVLAAVSKPEYADIVRDAVNFARGRLPSASVREMSALAMDRLLVQVGAQISGIVPGRVSVSVDPRIAHDYHAIIRKGETLVALLEDLRIPRSRILIKIPATYEGIRAAQALEHPSTGEPIHTNMTLVFGRVQALACAQAGVSVISPFIGRVKDWWDVNGGAASELSQHPGILLVQNIRSTYAAHGYTRTQIMAAGFRAVEEIIELGKYGVAGGPDLVTLPPNLLDGLRTRTSLGPALKFTPHPINLATAPHYFGGPDSTNGASLYARDILEERIADTKVPEGLAKFSVDAQILEDLVKRKVLESAEVSAML